MDEAALALLRTRCDAVINNTNAPISDRFEAAHIAGFAFTYRNTELALEYFTRSINLLPENTEGYTYRCFVYVEARSYSANNGEWEDEALADCNRALELDPDNDEALLARAWVHLAMNNYDLAVVDALRARDMDYWPEATNYVLARSYFRLDQFELALTHIEVTLSTLFMSDREYPIGYDSWQIKTEALLSLGRIDDAVAYVDSYISQASGLSYFTDLSLQMLMDYGAEIFSEYREHEISVKYYNEMIARWPDDPLPIYSRGFEFKHLGDTVAASKDFMTAIEMGETLAVSPLAEILLAQGDPTAAAEILSTGIALEQADPMNDLGLEGTFLGERADIRLRQGDYAAALADLDAGLRLELPFYIVEDLHYVKETALLLLHDFRGALSEAHLSRTTMSLDEAERNAAWRIRLEAMAGTLLANISEYIGEPPEASFIVVNYALLAMTEAERLGQHWGVYETMLDSAGAPMSESGAIALSASLWSISHDAAASGSFRAALASSFSEEDYASLSTPEAWTSDFVSRLQTITLGVSPFVAIVTNQDGTFAVGTVDRALFSLPANPTLADLQTASYEQFSNTAFLTPWTAFEVGYADAVRNADNAEYASGLPAMSEDQLRVYQQGCALMMFPVGDCALTGAVTGFQILNARGE